MKTELGKLEQIADLRSVWKDEARDFTPWLAKEENLAILSKTIGINNIVLEERESKVGGFSVDLYATEEDTGRNIIIENQLEETDHDHLGKIITYASGKDAEVIVWIVKRARDEHRQAIEWLNQHTDEKLAFFLIEIELWRIDDSALAPKFNIVEQPNGWTKIMRKEGSPTGLQALQLSFWQDFKSSASNNSEFIKNFSLHKPLAQHWYDLSVGTSAYNINLSVVKQKGYITAGIYINDNKDINEQFKAKEALLKATLGDGITWRDAAKASGFFVTYPFDILNEDKWQEAFDWFCDRSVKLKNIIKEIQEQ